MTQKHFTELRDTLENVYSVTQDGELCYLKDLTIHPTSILSEDYLDVEAGMVLRKSKEGYWQHFEQDRRAFSDLA